MDVTPRNSAAEHTNVTDAPGMLLCLLTNSFWLLTLVRSCPLKITALISWLRSPAVEHRSLAGVLSLSCARLAADG